MKRENIEEERWLNRSRKISAINVGQEKLELEMAKVLSKLYPINIIGFEDVSFNHYKGINE